MRRSRPHVGRIASSKANGSAAGLLLFLSAPLREIFSFFLPLNLRSARNALTARAKRKGADRSAPMRTLSGACPVQLTC
ncbi:hypothetical protein NOVOSPHI9U_50233 [Novosphingobium sp. 9U]|nr:hypothetical protein NOVOSPHI9U_50233 [Novosphingobium sp. 9U]